MVVDADAVVQPWAMVVEALDTPIADGAVARSGRSEHLTVGAHLARVDLLEKLQEVVLRAKVTRVAGRCDKET